MPCARFTSCWATSDFPQSPRRSARRSGWQTPAAELSDPPHNKPTKSALQLNQEPLATWNHPVDGSNGEREPPCPASSHAEATSRRTILTRLIFFDFLVTFGFTSLRPALGWNEALVVIYFREHSGVNFQDWERTVIRQCVSIGSGSKNRARRHRVPNRSAWALLSWSGRPCKFGLLDDCWLVWVARLLARGAGRCSR